MRKGDRNMEVATGDFHKIAAAITAEYVPRSYGVA
tara:strand:- start:2796 stop:2900 length:105 start_codon:yes stop_codon:yes gene_type:complete